LGAGDLLAGKKYLKSECMKNKTVHTSNETVIVSKIVETKILAIGKAVHCCAFMFLVCAMVNYRPYELYSLGTIHRF